MKIDKKFVINGDNIYTRRTMETLYINKKT
jgi:hypothetical protein